MAGSTGLMAGLLPVPAHSREELVTVTLLHTNDLHSQVEPFDENHPRFPGRAGLARISQFVSDCRSLNPNVLLFDAGDFSQGTPYFNYFRGDLMLKLMSEMDYDAGTLGNHEFDNGLQGLEDSLKFAGFPLVNSNYDFSGTVLAGKIPRFKIFNRSGVKIGVYGLGVDLKGLVNEKHYGAVRYSDPVSTAQEMEKLLAGDHRCDIVVCLSHLGLRYQNDRISDLTLAPETSFTDVIIGGHTHSFLEEPIRVKNRLEKEVVVNHAHFGGLVVGRLDFVFQRDRPGIKRIFGKLQKQV
jgi:5'-nucleotidase